MNSADTMPASAVVRNLPHGDAERRGLHVACLTNAREGVFAAMLALTDLVEAAQDSAKPPEEQVLGGPAWIDKHAVEVLKNLRAIEGDLALLAGGA